MRLRSMLSAGLRVAVMLFLIVGVVSAGAPAIVPSPAAYARVSDPAMPLQSVGDMVTTVSGSPQSTTINTAFPAVLVAVVLDLSSLPISELTVTFRAPTTSGVASGTFAGGGATVEVISDINGVATSPVFTANSVSGVYQVRATVSGGATEAIFDLENLLPPTVTPTVTATTGLTMTPTSTATVTPTSGLTVTATPTSTPPLPTPVVGGRAQESSVSGSAGAGSPPLVTVQNPDGTVRLQFYAYPVTFLGGVRVAMADMNGDGIPDIITAPGPGGASIIRVFDGRNASIISQFLAFPANFLGGAWVAAGDLDDDGQNEIVVGAGEGGGTTVLVFNGQTGAFIREIKDFTGEIAPDEEGDLGSVAPRFLTGVSRVKTATASTGGVHVAVGDLDGDGVGEIIADFVATESGVSSSAFGDQFLALLLLDRYGNNSTRCRARSDNSLLLGLLLASGDLNSNGFDSMFMGADGGSSIFQMSLLGSGNNRRCLRRRNPYRYPFGVSAQTDQSFTRPAVGTDAQGNAVLYGGASGAGPVGWVAYGSDDTSTTSSAGTRPQAVGPGGTYIAAVAPKTAASNTAQRASRDEDSQRRLTETERRQKERTNRLGLDDDRTEGNVVSVGTDDRGPFAVIANRDGLVTVLLRCDGGCPTIQEGQYLEADGVKEHEQLFTAYDVNVSAIR